MSLRLIGPILGFLFAAGCLRIFISPTLTPFITNHDPRWLGAWWAGWVFVGAIMSITSITIAMFPRELPRAVLKRRMKNNMRASQSSLAKMTGSQIIPTGEATAENALPKFSGK